MIDEEISRIVRDSQRSADEILRKDIEILHRIAKELLKYETLEVSDLDKILKGQKITRPLNGQRNNKKPRKYVRRANGKKPANNKRSQSPKSHQSKNNLDKGKKTPSTKVKS